MIPLGWRGMEVLLLLCAGRMVVREWIKQHPSIQGAQFVQLQPHFIYVYTHDVPMPSSCPQLVHRTELPILWFLMRSTLRVRTVVSLTMVQRTKSTIRIFQYDEKPLSFIPSPLFSLPWAQQPARDDLRQKNLLRALSPLLLCGKTEKGAGLSSSPHALHPGKRQHSQRVWRGVTSQL